MGVIVKNATLSVSISLTVLKMVGFWAPEHLTGTQKQLYGCFSAFSFMFLLGTYLIIQVVDLFLIWGDIPLMTGTAFLLFTNMAQAAKIVNILVRKKRIQDIVNDADKVLSEVQSPEELDIVKSCNREMIVLQVLYFSLTLITTLGWATSAEKHQLPLRAWMLMGLPRFCSASGMFTHAHVDGFLAIVRQRSASLLCRVRASSNSILKTIAGRYDSSLLDAILQRCMTNNELNCADDEKWLPPATYSYSTKRTADALPTLETKLQSLMCLYPYDTTKSPAYELTYIHQIGALLIAAYLNVAKDTLVAALIAQCRCRLRLLGHSLRTLVRGLETGDKYMLSPKQEERVNIRLRSCVAQHQEALEAAKELQVCFSEPTFAQLTVSLIIICVTAFQLSMAQSDNIVRLMSMGTYLLNMTFQVFIYCYQGNQLSEESTEIAGAAYECPWYKFSLRLRRALLIVMVRTRRALRLTAGGFTTLSLASFMAIIKASYSLFTLLQQVNEN